MEVKQLFQESVSTERRTKDRSLVPFISTFSSTTSVLNSKIKANFKKAQGHIEALSQFKPIAAFRRNKNLKDILVHASLNKCPKKNELGKYFKRVQYIENRFTHRGEPVRGTHGPNSRNLVYCIECQVCKKLYIGQTKNTLSARLKQHLYSITKTLLTFTIILDFTEVTIC